MDDVYELVVVKSFLHGPRGEGGDPFAIASCDEIEEDVYIPLDGEWEEKRQPEKGDKILASVRETAKGLKADGARFKRLAKPKDKGKAMSNDKSKSLTEVAVILMQCRHDYLYTLKIENKREGSNVSAWERPVIDAIKSLIENGADPKDPRLIHLAVEIDDQDIVQMLIDLGAAEPHPIIGGASLAYTTEGDYLDEMCRFLVAQLRKPIHHFAAKGDLKAIDAILSEEGSENLENIQDEDGNTPLHIAIECDHIELAEWLIEMTAEVNRVARFGKTPLMLAADKGYTELFSMLLDYGANPEITGSCDDSIFHTLTDHELGTGCPVEEGVKMIHLLIERGIRPRALSNGGVDSDGYTPLDRAIFSENNDLIKVMLMAGGRHLNNDQVEEHQIANLAKIADSLLDSKDADKLPEDILEDIKKFVREAEMEKFEKEHQDEVDDAYPILPDEWQRESDEASSKDIIDEDIEDDTDRHEFLDDENEEDEEDEDEDE